MRVWGRVAGGRICELVETDLDIVELFHPDLSWVDVTDIAGVAAGWLWDGGGARAPERLDGLDECVVANG